jgi:hypothetical protein
MVAWILSIASLTEKLAALARGWKSHLDTPHSLALLRPRRERPRCRAANKRYEVAPLQLPSPR